MPPRAAGGTPLTQEDIIDLIASIAPSSQQLDNSMFNLQSPQAHFMRSAADADANIGLSKSHSLLLVEIVDIHTVDSTVDDDHRSEGPPNQSARPRTDTGGVV